MPVAVLRSLYVSACIMAGVVTLPTTTAAQAPDTTAFEAGQWGAEIGLEAAFASLGLLRFSTPNRAWIGAVGASIQRTRSDVQQRGFEPDAVARSFNDAEIALRLGHRWYRTMSSRVQQHATVGVIVLGGRERAGPTFPSSQWYGGGGAFVDVGALYMVTPRLSIGAAWSAEASRVRSRGRSEGGLSPPETTTLTSTRILFGQVDIRAALYF